MTRTERVLAEANTSIAPPPQPLTAVKVTNASKAATSRRVRRSDVESEVEVEDEKKEEGEGEDGDVEMDDAEDDEEDDEDEDEDEDEEDAKLPEKKKRVEAHLRSLCSVIREAQDSQAVSNDDLDALLAADQVRSSQSV